MGSSNTSSGVTRVEPPQYQLPYLQSGLQNAQQLFNQGAPQQYGGQTVAGFSPQQEQAFQLIENRATQGSPLVGGASQFVQNTLSSTPSSSLGNVSNPFAGNAVQGTGANPYAANAVQSSGANPFSANAVQSTAPNPYSSNAVQSAGPNPYAGNAAPVTGFNPFSGNALSGMTQYNPFGGVNNPLLDQTFSRAAEQSRNVLESEFARAGRNINAAAPIRGDQLNNLATQIYAPAYENERNRQLQYQSQLTGLNAQGALQGQNIGAQSFENLASRLTQGALQGQQIGAQSFESDAARRAQGALAAQGIGAQSYENNAARLAQGALAAQGIGAQSFENNAARLAQGALAAQGIGAQSFENNAARLAQGALAGQSIGAQGFENAQQRALADLMAQRSNQLGALGSVLPLANQDYLDYNQLLGVGGQVQGLANQIMQDRQNRFNYEQNAPGMALDQYLSRVRGTDFGSTQTTTQRTPRNALGGALGGAMMGAPFGPVGILLGGLGGGLLGG